MGRYPATTGREMIQSESTVYPIMRITSGR